ncbi:MAG TPA: hypothetical protein VIV11_38255 [Kofleriaceae bacterium]
MELFCRVGDVVEVTHDAATASIDGEAPRKIAAGSRYRAVALVEWGWDLERVAGDGPDELRILNSQMPRYVKRIDGD